MSVPIKSDVTSNGLDRLLSQWEGKQAITGLFQSYLDNIQSLEDMWFQLLEERDIYTAIGEQLDNLGAIVGEPRLGRPDEEYRQAILNRIATNASDGTPPKVLQILSLVTQGSTVTLFEHFPANVHYMTDGTTTDLTTQTMGSSSSAGVSVRVMVDNDSNSFIPATTITSLNTLGVDDTGTAPSPPLDTMGVDIDGAQPSPPEDELGVASFITVGVQDRSYLPHAPSRDMVGGPTPIPLKNPLCAVLFPTQREVVFQTMVDDLLDDIVVDTLDEIELVLY